MTERKMHLEDCKCLKVEIGRGRFLELMASAVEPPLASSPQSNRG
jgi:hypothetical protein